MSGDLAAHYELTQDVDCINSASLNAGAGFIPIGGGTSDFTGTFDGQDHAILSLAIPGSGSSNRWGLFGMLGGSAVVSNLEIRNGSVTGNDNVGMVAGFMENSSQLTRVISSATVSSTGTNAGGLAGAMHDDTSITGSSSVGDVTSSGGETYGGLAGWVDGQAGHTITFMNVYHRGAVTATAVGAPYTGGLVGFGTHMSLTLGYNAGSVTGASAVGGIAGLGLSSTITDIFSAASVTGTDTDVGPFLGDNISNTLSRNYFDSVVAGVGTDSISGATAINDSTYFYDSSNAAFTNWDFSGTWRENYHDYPSLVPMRDPEMLCEQVVVTLSTVHVHCLVDPPGWGTPTWVMRYRKASDSDWHSVSLADIHVDEATISGLTSGTDYVVQFQFTDDWGTGPWGTINATTLGVAPSEAKQTVTAPAASTASYSLPTDETTSPAAPTVDSGGASKPVKKSAAASLSAQTDWASVSVTLGVGFIVLVILVLLFGRRLWPAHRKRHAKS